MSLPLAGRRIVVTRPRQQAGAMCQALRALGAEPILAPAIEIAPLEDYAALDQALKDLAGYDWVVFTSVNGVAAVWERLGILGLALPSMLKAAAIGPATAGALRAQGVEPAFMPDEHVAEAIVPGLGDVCGQRILLPRADIARQALAVELAERGAIVDEIAAYRTLAAAPDADWLDEVRRGVDAVAFMSSSTVRNFLALSGGLDQPGLRGAAVACIGPITARTAREAGLRVDLVAAEYTLDGLVKALAGYFARPELETKDAEWNL